MTAHELPPRPGTRGGPRPALELRQLSKGYGRPGATVLVLSDVSLTLRPGEFVAVIGPAASGKTTLLKLIAGLEQPTSGSVTVAGVVLGELGQAALSRFRLTEMGTALPGMPLVEGLDLLENVALPLLLAGVERRSAMARARAVMQEVALLEDARLAPEDASPSQRQRAAIARALVGGGPLLLLDEPTSDLGPMGADHVLRGLRRQIDRHGRTVVIGTRQAAVAAHADREYRLRGGELEGF